jgi:hypothetical protein
MLVNDPNPIFERHRLNRGGDRQANAALFRVILTRMRSDERTRDYVARRTTEGLSKREIMRCLKPRLFMCENDKGGCLRLR